MQHTCACREKQDGDIWTPASWWIITGWPVKCRTPDRQDDGGTEGFDISSAASLHFLWQDEEDVHSSQGARNKDVGLLNRWRGVEQENLSSVLHRCAHVVSPFGLSWVVFRESRAGRRKIDRRRHRPTSPPLISSFLAKAQQLQTDPAVAGCLPRC